MTAIEWFWIHLPEKISKEYFDLFEQAKAMEKEQMKDAVMYGLDEDGHTGDWKINVAESYYIKTFMGENNK